MNARHYSQGKTCSTCKKPIVNHSKYGRCHACFLKDFNKDPEVRARRSEGLKRRFREDPECYARKIKILNRSREKAFADPEVYARLQAHGRKAVANLFTPEAIARKIAARPKMAAAVSATKLAWCPEEYRDRYRALMKTRKFRSCEARELILQIAADEAALRHIDSALDYLRHYAPVAKLENGYRYGNAILRPSEVIDRAKIRGWQPDRWAA